MFSPKRAIFGYTCPSTPLTHQDWSLRNWLCRQGHQMPKNSSNQSTQEDPARSEIYAQVTSFLQQKTTVWDKAVPLMNGNCMHQIPLRGLKLTQLLHLNLRLPKAQPLTNSNDFWAVTRPKIQTFYLCQIGNEERNLTITSLSLTETLVEYFECPPRCVEQKSVITSACFDI